MEKNKVIDFYKAKKRISDEIFFDNFCIGEFICINSITPEGVVDYKMYAHHAPGILFGDDFVTLDDVPRVYPVDLEMGEGSFYNDDKPGIYVSKLYFYENNEENKKVFKNYMEKFSDVEKWYFDEFLPNDVKNYSFDSKFMEQLDEIYKKLTKKDESEIIKFKK